MIQMKLNFTWNQRAKGKAIKLEKTEQADRKVRGQTENKAQPPALVFSLNTRNLKQSWIYGLFPQHVVFILHNL